MTYIYKICQKLPAHWPFVWPHLRPLVLWLTERSSCDLGLLLGLILAQIPWLSLAESPGGGRGGGRKNVAYDSNTIYIWVSVKWNRKPTYSSPGMVLTWYWHTVVLSRCSVLRSTRKSKWITLWNQIQNICCFITGGNLHCLSSTLNDLKTISRISLGNT